MQTLLSLETRLDLQHYSKGQPVLFTTALSCIQSKKWKWVKSTTHPGYFCWSAHRLLLWRKRSVLPLVNRGTTVYAVGVPEKCFLSPMATSSLHGTNGEQILLYLFTLFVIYHSRLLQNQHQRNNSGARGLWLMHVFICAVVIPLLPVLAVDFVCWYHV